MTHLLHGQYKGYHTASNLLFADNTGITNLDKQIYGHDVDYRKSIDTD